MTNIGLTLLRTNTYSMQHWLWILFIENAFLTIAEYWVLSLTEIALLFLRIELVIMSSIWMIKIEFLLVNAVQFQYLLSCSAPKSQNEFITLDLDDQVSHFQSQGIIYANVWINCSHVVLNLIFC